MLAIVAIGIIGLSCFFGIHKVLQRILRLEVEHYEMLEILNEFKVKHGERPVRLKKEKPVHLEHFIPSKDMDTQLGGKRMDIFD